MILAARAGLLSERGSPLPGMARGGEKDFAGFSGPLTLDKVERRLARDGLAERAKKMKKRKERC